MSSTGDFERGALGDSRKSSQRTYCQPSAWNGASTSISPQNLHSQLQNLFASIRPYLSLKVSHLTIHIVHMPMDNYLLLLRAALLFRRTLSPSPLLILDHI